MTESTPEEVEATRLAAKIKNYERAKTHILSQYSSHSYENRYGQINDGMVDFHKYVCHARLNNSSPMTEIFVSCIYYGDDWPLDEQAMYFEYILDPRTSPWHEIIPDLDLDVIRLKGRPHVVIVRNLNFNRYMMFSFLKAFRQIYERQHAMKIFTDYLKSLSEEERLSRETYRYFLMTHLFGGAGSLKPVWGGDHHVFHGMPTQALIDRKIHGVDKKRKTCTFQDDRFYYRSDLYDYVWGKKGDYTLFNVAEIASLFKEGSVFGNIFDRPTDTSSSSVAYKTVSEKFPEFIEKFQEKYGKIEFTPTNPEEQKEKAA